MTVNTTRTTVSFYWNKLYSDSAPDPSLPPRVSCVSLQQRGMIKYFELDKEFKTASYGRKMKTRNKT